MQLSKELKIVSIFDLDRLFFVFPALLNIEIFRETTKNILWLTKTTKLWSQTNKCIYPPKTPYFLLPLKKNTQPYKYIKHVLNGSENFIQIPKSSHKKIYYHPCGVLWKNFSLREGVSWIKFTCCESRSILKVIKVPWQFIIIISPMASF